MKYLYFGTHGGLKAIGEENIPKEGPAIIASLHVSHMDPPAVACGMNRRLRFMAKEELFHNKILGWIIWSVGGYPIKRGESDMESIRKTIAYLEQGDAVLIFPEGTRGDGEAIGEMGRGVAMLAKRTKVPIVPVGLIGTNIVMPKGKAKGKRFKCKVIYGKPFTYEEVATGRNDRENRDVFSNELQRRIVALCVENGLALKISQGHSNSVASSDSD